MDKVIWIDENAGPRQVTVRKTADGDFEVPIPDDLVSALGLESCEITNTRWTVTGELVIEFSKT